ncbi:MAG: hypothetical protein R3B70_47295 [Polyangiaceae bacterium]
MNTTSGCAPASDIGSAAPASSGTTVCPCASIAFAMAEIVVGESNSA